MCWTVYILRCADNSLYTGITNDLARRLQQHNQGNASKYTRVRTPVTLAYSECSEDRSAASRREWDIKQLTKKAKEALIAAVDSR